MILIGITQGAQPILSLNHGRRDKAAVNGIFKLGVGACLAASAMFIAACLAFDASLIGLFGDGGETAALAADMLAVYCLAYVPVGVSLMNILLFQTTEREAGSTLVSVLRCVGFVQAFLLVLPVFFGEYGIYLSFLAGELCNWGVSEIVRARYANRRPLYADAASESVRAYAYALLGRDAAASASSRRFR